ncbi:MAG TPA: hypothetical protein VMY34_11625 [Acidimicrobiales bacterium]|nr:hypothetical protein [Acidimicrobiales bacterium]
MDEAQGTDRVSVVLHGLLNDMGVIATAARTLVERWGQLEESERTLLLRMIEDSVGRGIGQLETLTIEHSR